MHWLDLYAIPIIIRTFLVVLFPFSALDKIFDWNDALQQAKSSFLPGGPVLLVLSTIVELVAPFCVVFGWHDRLAAFVLAVFCVVTALLYHNFWHYPDFWRKGDSKARRIWRRSAMSQRIPCLRRRCTRRLLQHNKQQVADLQVHHVTHESYP